MVLMHRQSSIILAAVKKMCTRGGIKYKNPKETDSKIENGEDTFGVVVARPGDPGENLV